MDSTSNPTLELLLQAVAAGDLRLVDEHARPLHIKDCLDQHCWAHLRDIKDGKIYVHEIPGSRELTKPRYLVMLGRV